MNATVRDRRPLADMAGGVPVRGRDRKAASARVFGPFRGFMHISDELCMNRRVR